MLLPIATTGSVGVGVGVAFTRIVAVTDVKVEAVVGFLAPLLGLAVSVALAVKVATASLVAAV